MATPNANDSISLVSDSPSQQYNAVDISSADAVFTERLPRSLYIGGAGDVTVKDIDGTSVLFKAVPVGTTLPICCREVTKIGTTATYIVALY